MAKLKLSFLTMSIVVSGLVYFSYLQFIITSYLVYGVVFVLSFLFSLILVTIKKEKIGFLLKMLYLSFMFFFLLLLIVAFLFGENRKAVTYSVPLKGYYTRRVGGVLFEFKGTNVDRPMSKLGDLGEDIKKGNELSLDKYVIKISVKECFYGCYLIETLSLNRR